MYNLENVLGYEKHLYRTLRYKGEINPQTIDINGLGQSIRHLDELMDTRKEFLYFRRKKSEVVLALRRAERLLAQNKKFPYQENRKRLIEIVNELPQAYEDVDIKLAGEANGIAHDISHAIRTHKELEAKVVKLQDTLGTIDGMKFPPDDEIYQALDSIIIYMGLQDVGSTFLIQASSLKGIQDKVMEYTSQNTSSDEKGDKEIRKLGMALQSESQYALVKQLIRFSVLHVLDITQDEHTKKSLQEIQEMVNGILSEHGINKLGYLGMYRQEPLNLELVEKIKSSASFLTT